MIIQRLLKNKQRLYCLMLCTIACLVFSNLASAVEPQISAGRYHNLAVNDKGEVFWWGLYHDANFKLGLDEKAQGPTIFYLLKGSYKQYLSFISKKTLAFNNTLNGGVAK